VREKTESQNDSRFVGAPGSSAIAPQALLGISFAMLAPPLTAGTGRRSRDAEFRLAMGNVLRSHTLGGRRRDDGIQSAARPGDTVPQLINRRGSPARPFACAGIYPR
jgi:hypothetical protein